MNDPTWLTSGRHLLLLILHLQVTNRQRYRLRFENIAILAWCALSLTNTAQTEWVFQLRQAWLTNLIIVFKCILFTVVHLVIISIFRINISQIKQDLLSPRRYLQILGLNSTHSAEHLLVLSFNMAHCSIDLHWINCKETDSILKLVQAVLVKGLALIFQFVNQLFFPHLSLLWLKRVWHLFHIFTP